MLGAIAGDIIGSPYEFTNHKNYNFPLFSEKSTFTDDSVLTVAVADALMHRLDIAQTLKLYANRYPGRGYGGSFSQWMVSESLVPYNSWGNGSAMRTSPIGFFFMDESDVLRTAREYAAVTHNHPEGIKGAQATAYAIFMAQQGGTKDDIRSEITRWFNYDLSRKLDDIRPTYSFDISCMGTVPEAITAFLESDDFEDAVRKAVSLGGDADTLACITGSIAEAYYGIVPDAIAVRVKDVLPKEFLNVIEKFHLVIEK